MRGQHMKTSKRNAEGSGSGCRPTIPNRLSPNDRIPEVPMMGLIWQDEIVKDRKKREWWAFYAGCAVGAATLAFSYLFLVRLTGGVCPQ